MVMRGWLLQHSNKSPVSPCSPVAQKLMTLHMESSDGLGRELPGRERENCVFVPVCLYPCFKSGPHGCWTKLNVLEISHYWLKCIWKIFTNVKYSSLVFYLPLLLLCCNYGGLEPYTIYTSFRNSNLVTVL